MTLTIKNTTAQLQRQWQQQQQQHLFMYLVRQLTLQPTSMADRWRHYSFIHSLKSIRSKDAHTHTQTDRLKGANQSQVHC